MLGPGIGWPVGLAGGGEQAAVDVLAVVYGGRAVEIGLHPIREGFVRRVDVGEQCIASMGRTLDEM